MQHSHLLNRRSVLRATNSIVKSLLDGGLLPAFQGWVDQLESQPGHVRLPGFNMLTASAGEPYKWFLPRPSLDIPDYLSVYEEFADRPLGRLRNPGAVAAKIYKGKSSGARMCKFLTEPEQWASPAFLLLAASRWLDSEVEGDTSVRLGPCLLQVTRDGCYSNFRKTVHPCRRKASDWGDPATVIPDVTAYHPTLRALSKLDDDLDQGVYHAACTVAHGLADKIITKEELKTLVSGKLVSAEANTQLVSTAIEQCEQILLHSGDGIMLQLYRAAVPTLIAAREFRVRFGPVADGSRQRQVRPDTRKKWLAILKGVEYAVA